MPGHNQGTCSAHNYISHSCQVSWLDQDSPGFVMQGKVLKCLVYDQQEAEYFPDSDYLYFACFSTIIVIVLIVHNVMLFNLNDAHTLLT